ncbi:PaaI family thioesterase [Polynucleobacter necessarius]|uniref:PaaI family thioesterase n=1 Tax=Polynucleobacter necessarius TaxID=576610 RepID=UPI000FE240B6|nr:PaaI family thioesterase [Polynucleobacter necessarius]
MHQIDNPFLESLGVTLTEWRPDYAEMQLEIAPNLQNRIGRIQGGVMCTLLDAVLGYAGLYVAPGEPALKNVTLSITTNFLNSAEGKALTAKGFIERKGRGIYFARGEVWLDSSTLLATGVGTFKYIR